MIDKTDLKELEENWIIFARAEGINEDEAKKMFKLLLWEREQKISSYLLPGALDKSKTPYEILQMIKNDLGDDYEINYSSFERLLNKML